MVAVGVAVGVMVAVGVTVGGMVAVGELEIEGVRLPGDVRRDDVVEFVADRLDVVA